MIGEARAAFGGDAAGIPGGLAEQGDFRAGDGFEGGEAVLDLGGERGVFEVCDLGEGEGDVDSVARWDAGDSGSGGFGIGRDGDAVDEAEVDDVEWDLGVVAVAECGEDVGFGEHGERERRSCGQFSQSIGLGMSDHALWKREGTPRPPPGGVVVLSGLFAMMYGNFLL
jgi:hypothetical protein